MVSSIRAAAYGLRSAARISIAWLVEMAATAAIVAAVVGFAALILERLNL